MNNLQRAVEDCLKELAKYAEGGFVPVTEHSADCVAHGEGQECCLEKTWIQQFLSDSIKKVLSDFVKETKLPYHSSFTTAEMADTEEVRLLTADNSGWNRAVDDIQSK